MDNEYRIQGKLEYLENTVHVFLLKNQKIISILF